MSDADDQQAVNDIFWHVTLLEAAIKAQWQSEMDVRQRRVDLERALRDQLAARRKP
jgi:hypothetical protein